MKRTRVCEVCGSSAGAAPCFDDGARRIVLCSAHADGAKRAGAMTAEALRALFTEAEGRRALLARRARHERRMFPPRPEGRRLEDGRRLTDGATARDK